MNKAIELADKLTVGVNWSKASGLPSYKAGYAAYYNDDTNNPYTEGCMAWALWWAGYDDAAIDE